MRAFTIYILFKKTIDFYLKKCYIINTTKGTVMAKETFTFTIEKEIIEAVDAAREKMIPQVSRSQFVEYALLDKIKKEERKQQNQ